MIYERTDADRRFDDCIGRLTELLLPDDRLLLLELDEIVGLRLVESERAGFRLGRMTPAPFDFSEASELAAESHFTDD